MCCSTLWPFFGPPDFHKTVEASNGKTQEFGCEAHGIHTQYPLGSSLGSSSQHSHQDSSRTPSEFGVCHQLEEIQFGTRTSAGISGVNCGLQADELFLTREKVSSEFGQRSNYQKSPITESASTRLWQQEGLTMVDHQPSLGQWLASKRPPVQIS